MTSQLFHLHHNAVENLTNITFFGSCVFWEYKIAVSLGVYKVKRMQNRRKY